ncbi:BglG family transcription antiterminator [Bacillus solitudinis]|uniref:BglG family transcription antiterminator n=1 Tax=Bacillus solitudinis TaxID=2014074 RepID=UPI000C23D55D|nr:BglG family transcription antiterminator [Bacillus solitudinis]
MNERQKELLRILLAHAEGALQLKELSEKLGCAEKTIRNDLDRLEESLQDYSSANLIRKPGLGILIDINGEDRSNLFNNILSFERRTTEERLLEIAFQLLTNDKAITLQHVADEYYVPKATIKKDMLTLGNWLQRFDLQLISKTRLGHVIQGLELNKRHALAHLSELVQATQLETNYVLDLFMAYEVTAVRKALRDMQREFSLSFTEDAIESLLVHVLIMIKRTRQKSPVFVHDAEKEKAVERREYAYARWLFNQLESAFRLSFPEEEQVYITWHLISGKRTGEDAVEQLEYNNSEMDIVNVLVGKMEKLTLFPFESDSILIKGLAVHMHSVISRIKYGFPITNPLLPNIKKMYPYMFNMAILTLEEIKSTFAIDIPEDEAAYIVLHFQASIERLEGKKEKKEKALIVCHMGIGMSHLLEAKIQQQYQEIDIVGCIAKAEVQEYLKTHKINFIISTVPLEKITHEYIVISPLFGQEDKKALNRFMEKLKKKRTEPNDSNSLIRFLQDDLVFFDVDKGHRYEVVEMLATSLYQGGYVEKGFIHSAVNRERTSSTAIGGRIAIPHGSPLMVKESVIAVALMREAMEWGNERVTLVMMLALSKENQQNFRSVMGQIAFLSESPFIVQELVEAQSYKDFSQILDRQR